MNIYRMKNRLACRYFLIMFVVIICPMYVMFYYLKMDFEKILRQQVGKQISQSITKSERDLDETFSNMENMSSIFASDSNLINTFLEETNSYYDKTVVFDNVLSNMMVHNLYILEGMKVTFFDNHEKIYTNWEQKLGDYKFILETEWIKECMESKGYIMWNISDLENVDSQGKVTYVSLARSIYTREREYIGTLILSLDQNYFINILRNYMVGEEDLFFICTQNGDILIQNDNKAENLDYVNKKSINISGEMLLEETGNRRLYLVNSYEVPKLKDESGNRIYVANYTNYEEIDEQVKSFTKKVQIVVALFVLFLIIISILLAKWIVKPIKILENEMKGYRLGDPIEKIDVQRSDEIGSLNRAFVRMSENINDLFKKVEIEHEAKEYYRYESLKAQINPHFLFNTLGSIRWMAIISGADNMVNCIDALSGVLKHAMNKEGELTTLHEEIESVKNYLYIQNVRYGDLYDIEINVSEEIQQYLVVRMILQPIVENAILHGFKGSKKRGQIKIDAVIEKECLRLSVTDNGKGISKVRQTQLNNTLEAEQISKSQGSIGFVNVHQRLRSVYGSPFGLSMESIEGEFTKVVYILPIIPESAEKGD